MATGVSSGLSCEEEIIHQNRCYVKMHTTNTHSDTVNRIKAMILYI
jgi:hypothetical protein